MSHAQPDPKRVAAAFANASLNPSKDPNVVFNAVAKLPLGASW